MRQNLKKLFLSALSVLLLLGSSTTLHPKAATANTGDVPVESFNDLTITLNPVSLNTTTKAYINGSPYTGVLQEKSFKMTLISPLIVRGSDGNYYLTFTYYMNNGYYNSFFSSNGTTVNYDSQGMTGYLEYNVHVVGGNADADNAGYSINTTDYMYTYTNTYLSNYTANSPRILLGSAMPSTPPTIYMTEDGGTMQLKYGGISYGVSGTYVTSSGNYTLVPNNIPQNLTSSNVTNNQATLNWNPVTNATSYSIYNGTTLLASNVTNPSNYVLTGLSGSTNYSISVTSIVGGIESAKSTTANFTTLGSPPTNVTASQVTSNSLNLSWDAVSGASSYKVYNGSTLLQSGITGTSYSLSGLTPNTAYALSVTTVVGSNESPKSNVVNVTTLSSPVSNLATSQITPNSLTLNWSGGSGSSINIYQNGTQIANGLPITTSSYNVTGLTPGTSYNFAVATVNSVGAESSQTTVSGTTTSITPTNLAASNVTSNSVDLSWDAVAIASSYNIYNGSTLLQSNVTNPTNHTLSGLSGSTSYALSVTAIVSGTESSQSNVVNVTTNAAATVPTAPQYLAATQPSPTDVDLTWDTVTGATSYNVYEDSTLLQSGITGTSSTVSGLSSGSSHTFTVTAVNAAGESAQSNAVSVTAQTVNPPTVSLAIDNGASQTTSTSATLQISASSSFYTASDLTMSFSTDGSTWTNPEPFATTKSWTLPSTPGNDPIFIRVTDPSGNAGIAYASIQYVSQTSSSIGGSSTQGASIGGNYPAITYNGISNVYVTQSNSVSLDLTAYTGMYASVSTDNISYSDLFPCDTPFNVTLPSGDGLKTVYVRLASSNNKAALGPVGYIYFLVDTTAPILNVTAVGNATVTTGTSFQVQLDASDNTTPLSALQYQVNGGSWSTVPSNQVISLSGFQQHSGLQTYQITVRDLVGNVVTKAITFWAV